MYKAVLTLTLLGLAAGNAFITKIVPSGDKIYDLNHPFSHGETIRAHGTYNKASGSGPSKFTLNFRPATKGQISLHVDFRSTRDVLVLNDYHGGSWKEEARGDIKNRFKNGKFVVDVIHRGTHFEIKLDGKTIKTKKPFVVGKGRLSGDIVTIQALNGPSHAKWTLLEIPRKCIENNFDYLGADIPKQNFPIKSFVECYNKCVAHGPECKSITYRKTAGKTHCWLKNKVNGGERLAKHNHLASANMNCAQGCVAVNEDYLGEDIKSVPSKGFEDCHSKCRAINGCKSFTLVKDSGTCWVKRKNFGGKHVLKQPKLVSYNMDCPPGNIVKKIAATKAAWVSAQGKTATALKAKNSSKLASTNAGKLVGPALTAKTGAKTAADSAKTASDAAATKAAATEKDCTAKIAADKAAADAAKTKAANLLKASNAAAVAYNAAVSKQKVAQGNASTAAAAYDAAVSAQDKALAAYNAAKE